jgi:hypothetical protein
MIPKIVFFARDYQARLFPKLLSDKYTNIYVTLTISEKKLIQKDGNEVAACFEEEFDCLEVHEIPDSYLKTSFVSDRFLGSHSLDERRIILSKEISFWERIFEQHKPLAVINEVVAIEIAEVMYIEATKRNIRYFAWMVSPFEQRQFYWLSIPFFSRLDDNIFKELPDEDSAVFAEKYFKKFNEDDNVKPFYASNLDSRYNVIIFIKWLLLLFMDMIKSGFSYRMNKYLKLYYFNRPLFIVNIVNYTNSIFHSYDKINKNHGIVFYPLHYEPEASILYMAEYSEDQIGLIRNLSKCLSNNQILVVKEHPQQPGMLLSKSYRQLRKRLSNVAFLPAEYSTKKLIQLSELVITQTSTAGWEALILGKPVVVLGKVFYDNYPKINRFCDFENLKIMIQNKQYHIPQKDETLKFIAQVWNYSQEGNPYPCPELYEKENITRIVHSIEQRLMELDRV